MAVMCKLHSNYNVSPTTERWTIREVQSDMRIVWLLAPQFFIPKVFKLVVVRTKRKMQFREEFHSLKVASRKSDTDQLKLCVCEALKANPVSSKLFRSVPVKELRDPAKAVTEVLLEECFSWKQNVVLAVETQVKRSFLKSKRSRACRAGHHQEIMFQHGKFWLIYSWLCNAALIWKLTG